MEDREINILIIVIVALVIGIIIGRMNFYVENCECEIHNDAENFIYEEDKVEKNYQGPVPENYNEDYFRDTGITKKE